MHIMTSPPDLGSAAQETLLQYGVLGLACLALGWFTWSTIKRERERVDEMDRWHREVVMPAMVKATEALSRFTDLMPDLVSALGSRKRS